MVRALRQHILPHLLSAFDVLHEVAPDCIVIIASIPLQLLHYRLHLIAESSQLPKARCPLLQVIDLSLHEVPVYQVLELLACVGEFVAELLC